MKKLISILIPTFNESDNVYKCYEEVKKELKLLVSYNHEIIFLDNRSEDDTFEKIKIICNKDSSVKAYRYSNNFGIQNSLMYGYSVAKGDAVIQIDCDLQDSPKVFKLFVDEWEKGNEVVYGVRKDRTDGFILNIFIKLFYYILFKISKNSIPMNAGDFRLISRKIIINLLKNNISDLYIRGAIAKIGFKQKGVEYVRKKRNAGKSKFNLFSYIDFAFTGITQYSSIPLRFILYLGIFIMIVSFLLILYYLFEKFYLGINVSGFATLVCLVLISIGINAIMIGIIGEYLNRVYSQNKIFNQVIVDEEINT
tara:strand:+ start:25300 stop:26229 length:930 start_codon:yes stop_codon:yes gene_type:complete